MSFMEYILICFCIFACVFIIINRLCECIERCSFNKAYSIATKNGVLIGISDFRDKVESERQKIDNK